MELGRPEGLRTAPGLVDSEVPIYFVDTAPQCVGKIEHMDVCIFAIVRIELQNS